MLDIENIKNTVATDKKEVPTTATQLRKKLEAQKLHIKHIEKNAKLWEDQAQWWQKQTQWWLENSEWWQKYGEKDRKARDKLQDDNSDLLVRLDKCLDEVDRLKQIIHNFAGRDLEKELVITENGIKAEPSARNN